MSSITLVVAESKFFIENLLPNPAAFVEPSYSSGRHKFLKLYKPELRKLIDFLVQGKLFVGLFLHWDWFTYLVFFWGGGGGSCFLALSKSKNTDLFCYGS